MATSNKTSYFRALRAQIKQEEATILLSAIANENSVARLDVCNMCGRRFRFLIARAYACTMCSASVCGKCIENDICSKCQLILLRQSSQETRHALKVAANASAFTHVYPMFVDLKTQALESIEKLVYLLDALPCPDGTQDNDPILPALDPGVRMIFHELEKQVTRTNTLSDTFHEYSMVNIIDNIACNQGGTSTKSVVKHIKFLVNEIYLRSKTFCKYSNDRLAKTELAAVSRVFCRLQLLKWEVREHDDFRQYCGASLGQCISTVRADIVDNILPRTLDLTWEIYKVILEEQIRGMMSGVLSGAEYAIIVLPQSSEPDTMSTRSVGRAMRVSGMLLTSVLRHIIRALSTDALHYGDSTVTMITRNSVDTFINEMTDIYSNRLK